MQIAVRNTQVSGAPAIARGIPLEMFSTNKDMGRILIRRGGETIAAGMFLHIHDCMQAYFFKGVVVRIDG